MEGKTYTLINTFEWVYNDITEWVRNMCIHEEFAISFTEAHSEYKYSIVSSIDNSLIPYSTIIEIYKIC